MLELFLSLNFGAQLFYVWLMMFTLLCVKDILFKDDDLDGFGLARHFFWPVVQPLRLCLAVIK